MAIPKIKIKQEGIRTLVYMDGEQIHGIRGIHFDRTVDGECPILKLDILATDMEIDCVAVPELPDVLKDFYVRKGD